MLRLPRWETPESAGRAFPGFALLQAATRGIQVAQGTLRFVQFHSRERPLDAATLWSCSACLLPAEDASGLGGGSE